MHWLIRILSMAPIAFGGVFPCMAQEATRPPEARLPAERISERQIRENTMVLSNPIGRINSRIPTRVLSRINTRLDRNYQQITDPGVAIRNAAQQARRKSQ